MRRWLIAWALALVLFAIPVLAQTAPRIYWEHDGVNVTTFEYSLNGGAFISMGTLTPDTGTTYSFLLFPLGQGANTIIVRACNASSCTSAAAITVVKL